MLAKPKQSPTSEQLACVSSDKILITNKRNKETTVYHKAHKKISVNLKPLNYIIVKER